MAADALRSLLFEMKFWVRYALLPRSRYVAVYYPTPERTVERCAPLRSLQITARAHRPALQVCRKDFLLCTACRMLKLAECTAQDTVFDLGCGDGRVVGVVFTRSGCIRTP